MIDSRFEILIEYSFGDPDVGSGLTGSAPQTITIDTYKEESISLNFNIADLYDLGSRNSSYSKSIRIPETKKNRIIFGNISDLAASTTFNPNLKTRCWILSEGYVVFEGYLQLRNVYQNPFEDKSQYEIVVFADNDNFFKAVGEKYLTDLEWGELDHEWTAVNIVRSWTASTDSQAYYYPLIDYGFDFDYNNISRPPVVSQSNGVDVSQFFPATNVKYILDKIFADAGYTYQSNFLNSRTFKKLYVPYQGKSLFNPISTGDSSFSAGRLTSASFSTQYAVNPGGGIGNPGPTNYVRAYPTLLPPAGYGAFSQPYDFGIYRLPFNSEAAPNGDPDGVYNTATYEFTAPAVGLVRAMSFTVIFDITFQFGIDPDLLTTNPTAPHGPAGQPACSIAVRREKNFFGQNTPDQFVSVGGILGRIPLNSPRIRNLELLSPVTYTAYELNNNPNPGQTQVTRYKRVRGSIETDVLSAANVYAPNYKLFNGEKVWVELRLGIDSGEYREQINLQNGAGVGWGGAGVGYFVGPNLVAAPNIFQGTAQFSNVAPNNPLGAFASSLRFYNNISDALVPGDVIDYNDIIPKQIKNKDFISSLVKMFNLYIEPSRELDKVLIIEPRDEYYAAGQIKDWSRKIDLTDDIQEQILAETQNRELRFKYRDDNDFFNEDFRKRENINFGEYRKILENEFTQGIKTIEPIFGPTPLVQMTNSSRIIIPKIGILQNGVFDGTETNLRIGTRYEPDQTSPWSYGGLTTSVSVNFPDYAVITSQGIGPQRQQAFNPGDVITITQNDGGFTYPTLNGTHEILEVINSRTVVINLTPRPTFVGYIAGVATPVPGVVGGEYWNFLNGANFTRYNYYPYLGHFSHPRRPNYDLNYAQSFGYYHPLETVTDKTLFKEYWSSFVNEITDKDSRIITVSMVLDPQDIADFRFNDNIYINGQYYKVNKISNYDPTALRPCKVELIKSTSYRIPLTDLGFGGVFGRVQFAGPDRQPIIAPQYGYGRPTGALRTNGTNMMRSADSFVAGRNNTVAGDRTLVVGHANSVRADKNYVFGDLNTVDIRSESNLVLGSNNTIKSGVNNAFVVGDNLTIDSSNTLSFGGSLISLANLVSASKNEVLSPFNMKPANFISGSRNSVFEWGSQDPVNFISGGFYYNDI